MYYKYIHSTYKYPPSKNLIVLTMAKKLIEMITLAKD